MTFIAFEGSRELARPVELFEFAIGLTGSTPYLFTSDGQNRQIAANNYVSQAISRDEIVLSGEDKRDRLKVTLPRDNPFVQFYAGTPPEFTATITIRRYHENDPDQEIVSLFKGTVLNFQYKRDLKTVELLCVPFTSLRKRKMPRRTFQGNCNAMLYGTFCGLNRADFRVDLQQDAVSSSGLVYTIDGAGAHVVGSEVAGGAFKGGYIQNPTGEVRYVINQDGVDNNDLHIQLPFRTPTANGTILTLFPGCDHLPDTCQVKFDNEDNYRGFHSVPGRNIFTSGV